MNYSKIDIGDTRKFKRIVVRKTWFVHILDFLTAAIYTLTYPVAIIFITIHHLVNGVEISSYLIINIFLSLIVSSLLTYSYLAIDKFKKSDGIDFEINKNAVLKTIETNKWNIRRNTKTMFIVSPKFDFFSLHWAKQFNILLDGNSLYVNVTSFGRFDMVSPFHWFADRAKERKLITEIKQNIEKVQQDQ